MELEDTRYELDDRIADIERDLEIMQSQRERVAQELSEPTVERHRTTVSLEQPERLDSGILEQAQEEGLTVLVEAGIVDRETIQMAIEQVCSSRQEPIQDRPDFHAPFGVLAPILAEENTDEWIADVEGAAMEAGFDVVETPVDTAKTLSIALLGLYAGIDLEATSEFGTLDEHLTDSERDLSELFGPEVETVPLPVAYPELQ